MAVEQPKRSTYFETNTLSDLSQLRDHAAHIPGIADVRRELLSSDSKRTLVVSQHLLSEMAGYEHQGHERRPFFEVDMAFLNSLPCLKVFKPQGDVLRLEVQRALTGRDFNPFIDAHFPISYRDPDWKSLFEGERLWVKQTKKYWAGYERDAKARIDEAHPDLEERRAQLTTEWKADRRGTIDRFVRHVMRSTREQLGLPTMNRRGPTPSAYRRCGAAGPTCLPGSF